MDVDVDDDGYYVEDVEIRNEPSGEWEDGDKPRIRVTLSADDDYKFSGISEDDVDLSGDGGTVTDVSYSSSTARVYITLSRLDDDGDDAYDLDITDLSWDEDDGTAYWEEPEDAERYQTIFADKEGAVVAPTAGMHFSKHLMKRMEIRGIDCAFLTLHAGLGNFRTVDVEDLSKHKMDSEQFIVPDATAGAVNRAKTAGRKVVSVGTTVMRTLETVVSTNGMINAGEGWTNKFIFSPYEFTVADAMVSNFQLPYSTQLMMVAAFGGYDCVMNAYKAAREEGYRFGTYGDAMLIL